VAAAPLGAAALSDNLRMNDPLSALAQRAGALARLPLLAGWGLVRDRRALTADIRRWNDVQPWTNSLLDLLAQPEFRTLYYLRLRNDGVAGRIAAKLLAVVYRPQPTLYITTSDIGPGFYIQHGFATIISARRIGANCWVNQQVTIGYDDSLGCPILEDGVTVHAGAQVIGGITVGAGSTVGANAVVVRDVPAGTTAIGVPAHRPQAPAAE
jgi:serine O-acetyltransferase